MLNSPKSTPRGVSDEDIIADGGPQAKDGGRTLHKPRVPNKRGHSSHAAHVLPRKADDPLPLSVAPSNGQPQPRSLFSGFRRRLSRRRMGPFYDNYKVSRGRRPLPNDNMDITGGPYQLGQGNGRVDQAPNDNVGWPPYQQAGQGGMDTTADVTSGPGNGHGREPYQPRRDEGEGQAPCNNVGPYQHAGQGNGNAMDTTGDTYSGPGGKKRPTTIGLGSIIEQSESEPSIIWSLWTICRGHRAAGLYGYGRG